jgi:hypothetical protein
MATHIANVNDVPELEGKLVRPGQGDGFRARAAGRKSTRFLGRSDEDPTAPTTPPFAYYNRRPAGDVTPEHRHVANRIEFLIEGEIEWRERGKEPVVYGPGTLTYVEAGTIYGYTVLKDATILILFDGSPGMNYA